MSPRCSLRVHGVASWGHWKTLSTLPWRYFRRSMARSSVTGGGSTGSGALGVADSRSPVAIREAVELIRRLLAGETVTVKGRAVSFADGRLDFAPPRADLPIYVASQRAAGCRAAGRVADG